SLARRSLRRPAGSVASSEAVGAGVWGILGTFTGGPSPKKKGFAYKGFSFREWLGARAGGGGAAPGKVGAAPPRGLSLGRAAPGYCSIGDAAVRERISIDHRRSLTAASLCVTDFSPFMSETG